MRNLRNIRHTRIQFDCLSLTASTWDAENDGVICAFGPTGIDIGIELKRFSRTARTEDEGHLIASWEAPCPLPDLTCDHILSLKYFAENRTICLILAGGDLVVVREAPQPDEDQIEIVGSVDAGISAAAWSADEELVAITTRANTFLLMTRFFESTANVPISPEDIKVSAHVSVGWGKRETQFQGKRAKAMRDPTVPEHVDEGRLSPHDDGKTTISWRGDGAYVAVNTLEDNQRRMIRVYSREGTLDSVSEPVDGLESALSWRPSGNLIAGVQHRETGPQVVFFERNGLRHGEFPLRFDGSNRPEWAHSVNLDWNTDSNVLAVSFCDRTQLWTMGNYHYYLKQEIKHEQEDKEGTVQTSWHPERPLMLTSCGARHLDNLAYSSEIALGSVLPPNDLGLVLVIDGFTLKVTPLDMANVPPPMAYVDVQVDHNIVDACSNPQGDRVLVLLSDAVIIFRTEFQGETPSVMNQIAKISLTEHTAQQFLARQITTNDRDEIFVLAASPQDICQDYIVSFDAAGHVLGKAIYDSHIISMSTSLDFKTILCQSQTTSSSSGSSLRMIRSEHDELDSQIEVSLVCPRFSFYTSDQTQLVFGLSAAGTLLVLGKEQDEADFTPRLNVKGVTSFLITTAHLIFTTTQHLVKFVHLRPGELQVPPNEPETDERCRSVERGARLVAVMPTSYSLVLQMPRGNLETIYPRALVLAGIRKAILSKDYRTAFSACRNHRVDMNILHDYASQQLLSHVDLFVEQIKKPVHIDLFLSQLREEDVTQTLYKETLDVQSTGAVQAIVSESTQQSEPTTTKDPLTTSSKVNRICDAFLTILDKRRDTHLQNIVTAHVCKSPPDLEAGLQLVADLRSTQPDQVDQAVEHICFLADVNRLYDAALGLYDLDVAVLVAQQSQKDPREYLTYMQSLESLEPLRKRFQIDNDLKRHVKALTHLFHLDAFEELKAYTTKHVLYSDAIELFKYNQPRLADLTRLFAEYLSSTNKNREAAIAFESLNDYTSASDSYFAAQMWRESLSCAYLAQHSPATIRTLAESLAEGATEGKEYAAAGQIYAEHLDDIPAAVRSWCKAYRFDEAIRMVGLRAQPALLTGVVDPGLAEGFAALTELLAEMKTQINVQVPRLQELRVKKAQDPLGFYTGSNAAGPNNGNDIPDDISLAGSTTSTSAGTFMTRYTARSTGLSTLASDVSRRTSKNKRREERKRARGKKGSVYEEEYLVASLGRLVERFNVTVPDVEGLVVGLTRRGMRERAAAVQNLACEVAALAAACVGAVFGQVQKSADAVEGGGDEVEQQQQQQQQQQEQERVVAPVVKQITKLTLLG